MNYQRPIAPARELVVVDLDGTLLRTDSLHEAVLALLRRRPWMVLKLALWALVGRAAFKTLVTRHARLDVGSLPLRSELIGRLETFKAAGAELVLATAAHRRVAERIAERTGLFDAVLASRARRNLKGAAKLDAIQSHAAGRPFTYIGDSRADRPIWAAAESAIFVDAPRADINAARRAGKPAEVLRSGSPFSGFARELRLHQWAKNALIFVPLLTAHAYGELSAVIAASLGFLCFGLCASGAYFLNDLIDLDLDRRHRGKRSRPLASGELALVYGVAGAVALPVLGLGLSALSLPWPFTATLAAYFVLTNAYSMVLKRVSTADVMTLAALFTLRLVGGAAAIGVALSFWLFAFSIFVFVSLAYLKRYIELAASGEEAGRIGGRNYWAADAETTFSLGTSSATASVIVLALFVNAPETASAYRTPEALWLLCFLMLYWTNRLWVGARRGKIDDDPILFALKDPVSRMIGLSFAATLVVARYLPV